MAGKKKAENFMKDVTTEKDWEALCDYQVNCNFNAFQHRQELQEWNDHVRPFV